MKSVYLIVNNLVLNNIDYIENEDIDTKRSKRPLSIEGEEIAKEISKDPRFKDITSIYSSGFASALATAKYLSSELNVFININNKLNERKIGEVNKQTNFQYYKENQEHDFNYKLPGGESFTNVKNRVSNAINEIVKLNNDDEIAIFTHSMVVTTYLSNWCKIEYNLDNNLLLNFNDCSLDQIGEFGIYKIDYDNNNKVINIEALEF